ncbi:MAG: hypothetical protein M1829_005629 [Trizodia sp. TS-e1964]|nr:MAG: hypothetical protein M1829_005629 [Trizodia sp. TS-e1964]
MTRLSFNLFSALAVLGAANAVLDLTPDNFDQIVLKSGKPALVEFFAPWCGHCKTLAPIYEELGQAFASVSDKVSIAKVDADKHKSLGKRFGVTGFPTLKWFDGKSDKPTDYGSGRDLESLTKFINEKTGVKPSPKKEAPSAVQVLTDSSFNSTVGRDQHVLVAFTAPWCGHCKTLAPKWEILAQDFVNEPTVLIAKVDAEAENSKATAKSFDITGFPTIKFFPKGSSTPKDYSGGRSEQDFIAFLNENAGTHRVVGGGLDDKAGTVAVLDELVVRYTGGEGIVAITAEAVELAKGLTDKYAPYYIKVLEKVVTSEGHVQKELARLEGILKKGGLAPLKVDDLVSRKNILTIFSGKGASKEGGKRDEL